MLGKVVYKVKLYNDQLRRGTSRSSQIIDPIDIDRCVEELREVHDDGDAD